MCDGISCSDGDCGKRSEQQMKRILPVIAALALCPPVQAAASPYAVASRMCQMMSNGVSRQQAWKYVVDEYATGSMQGWSQTWGAPQFGGGLFGTLGGGIGTALPAVSALVWSCGECAMKSRHSSTTCAVAAAMRSSSPRAADTPMTQRQRRSSPMAQGWSRQHQSLNQKTVGRPTWEEPSHGAVG